MTQEAHISSEITQRIALYDWHTKHGARMVPFAGYGMPVQYDGIVAEHLHVRKKAGLFDVSHMGVLEVSGYDVIKDLELLIPSDLAEQKIGSVKYGFIMNYQGGIEDDLLISRTSDKAFTLVLNAGRKHADIAYLQAHISNGTNMKLRDDLGILALQGPTSHKIMQTICPEATELKFMTTGVFEVNGHTATISRSGYTGEDGFEIVYPNSGLEWMADKLCEHQEVKPIGLGARDSLRLEAGLCLYGHDLTTDISPVEANLSWALGKRRREQGKFLGEDRIMTELESRPARRRVGILLDGRAIAREGVRLFTKSGDEIGVVTSGSFSPTLQKSIVMGYVDYDYNEIAAEIRSRKESGKIIKLPFVEQKYYKGI